MKDNELRELVPHVLSVLVRRGADFVTAEDAVQEALVAFGVDVEGRTARRPDRLADHSCVASIHRHGAIRPARRNREERFDQRAAARTLCRVRDDTLQLYFLCHPDLTPSSAVALDAAGRWRPHHASDRARRTSCPRAPWRNALVARSARRRPASIVLATWRT